MRIVIAYGGNIQFFKILATALPPLSASHRHPRLRPSPPPSSLLSAGHRGLVTATIGLHPGHRPATTVPHPLPRHGGPVATARHRLPHHRFSSVGLPRSRVLSATDQRGQAAPATVSCQLSALLIANLADDDVGEDNLIFFNILFKKIDSDRWLNITTAYPPRAQWLILTTASSG